MSEQKREIRMYEGDMHNLLWDDDNYEEIEKTAEDWQRHGWQWYTVIVKDKKTGQFFCAQAYRNDDEGWEDTDSLELREVFPKQVTITQYV